MSRLPVPGSDDNTWGDILNDFLAAVHNSDGTLKTGVVTTTQIADGTITTTDISSTAGITKTQLASSVQTSLGSADTALQSVPDATSSTKGAVQLAGDLSGTAASPSLATTGVSAGSYGSASSIPTFTVDAKGRLTSAGSQALPASLQSYQTSNTGNTYPGQWTKIATQTITVQYQDAQVALLLQAANDGEFTGSLVQLRLRTKQQNGFGSNPYVEAAIVNSTGAITPSNVRAVITQNTPSTIVDFYLQINEYNRLYYITVESVINVGSATTQVLGAQGFVATGSLPSGVSQQAAKYDPVNPASGSLVGGVQLTGDLGGTATAPTTPTAVHVSGTETVAGSKTFTSSVTINGNSQTYINQNTGTTQYSGALTRYLNTTASMTGAAGFQFGTVISDTNASVSNMTLDSLDKNGSYLNTPLSIDLTSFQVNIKGLLQVGNNRIINVGTPTTSTDAATKAYVDGKAGGITRSVNQVSGAMSAAAVAQTDYVYFWTGTTAYTLTMPTAIGNTNLYTLKNASSVSQTVMPFSTSPTQSIESGVSITIRPNNSVDLISDGTSNWMVL